MKLIEADPRHGRVTIWPKDTRDWNDSFLGPKYSAITAIILPADLEPDCDIFDILENLPSGFTKDYEYGLGLARELDVLVDLLETATECTVIELMPSGDTSISRETFRLSLSQLDQLRGELGRIKNRGEHGIHRVRKTYVHNELASVLGLKTRQLSLGRLPVSKWMTQVAAGAAPLSDEEQSVLLEAASLNVAQIASKSPAKVVRLQREIEVVSLEQLIATYTTSLGARHNEDWWQDFFEQNVFALQLLFGGPTVFVDAQVPIGEGSNSGKGLKIADYLLKSTMTNNASLVEIKKPSTRLMKRRPYRQGVYGVQSEIGEAVTQVLDQALQLTRHETATRRRSGDASWVSNAPRCFVVAGLASELDTDDKKKSFDLYREHLAGVRLVTYDELLCQLTSLRDFLASDSVKTR